MQCMVPCKMVYYTFHARIPSLPSSSVVSISTCIVSICMPSWRSNFFHTGRYFFSNGDPPLGGGGYEKSGSYKKNFFFSCCTYHTQ